MKSIKFILIILLSFIASCNDSSNSNYNKILVSSSTPQNSNIKNAQSVLPKLNPELFVGLWHVENTDSPMRIEIHREGTFLYYTQLETLNGNWIISKNQIKFDGVTSEKKFFKDDRPMSMPSTTLFIGTLDKDNNLILSFGRTKIHFKKL